MEKKHHHKKEHEHKKEHKAHEHKEHEKMALKAKIASFGHKK